MTIGQRIQELRVAHGLSQEALAERLDTTRQTVSRWELDQSYPTLEKIVRLSRLFSVTTDSILKDGISTFDGEESYFSCGVWRGPCEEIVESERFALVLFTSRDKMRLGARLYRGYEKQKRLVALCERDRREQSTTYAYLCENGKAEDAISNSPRLVARLGEAYEHARREGMRQLERFAVDRTSAPLPTVREAGIPRCLTVWRMADSYRADGEQLHFYLFTGRTEYIFSIRPTDTDIYCGASYNAAFDLGLMGGRQFFRIRNYRDNGEPWCRFHADFDCTFTPTEVPTEACELGKCVRTRQGYLWCVKRYTDEEIVLQGCGEDEYVYRRGDGRTERFVPLPDPTPS